MRYAMRRKCDDERRAKWTLAGVCAVAAALLLGWGAREGQQGCRANAARRTEGKELVAQAAEWAERTKEWAADWRTMAAGGVGGAKRLETGGDVWPELRAERDAAEVAERARAKEALAAVGFGGGGAEKAEEVWKQLAGEVEAASGEVAKATRWPWAREKRYRPAAGRLEKALAAGNAAKEKHGAWAAARDRLKTAAEAEEAWWTATEWQDIAEKKAAEAEEAMYGAAGGFGGRMAQMRAAIRAGDEAKAKRDFPAAKEAYERACEAASWMANNVQARSVAWDAEDAAASQKRAADEMDGVETGQPEYQKGLEARDAADKAFEEGRFAESTKAWRRAESAWAKAESKGRNAKASAAMEKANEAFAHGRWVEAEQWAKRATVFLPELPEALALQKKLPPTKVRFLATAGGKAVEARVRSGPGAGRMTGPETAVAVKAGKHRFEMDWAKDGKWYEWSGDAEVRPHETTEVSGVLKEFAPRAGDTRTLTLPGGATMEMVWCPPGSFEMRNRHSVQLTRGFWMAKTEVTQRQWYSVMGGRAAGEKESCPVENVTWTQCAEFCKKAGLGLQLPTEAQWEYACRAGNTEKKADRLDAKAWYAGNSKKKVHPVAQKEPNAWGLFDMHGNVREWCADWYDWFWLPRKMKDPKGADTGEERVIRGGGHDSKEEDCQFERREKEPEAFHKGNLGFRPVRETP